MSGKSGHLYVN